jgi:hypothetical protein
MDKSFFGRLKNVFSRQSIVTHISNNKIKVIDINKYQQTGGLENNYSASRFTRLYQGNTNIIGGYGSSTIGYQTGVLRNQLYSEYELMNQDAIISQALNILSSQATTKNLKGDILRISSSDEEIKSILHNLFYDILNIQDTLFGLIRETAMYGDHFRYLKLVENYGVVGWIPMSPYVMSRVEDPQTSEIKFYYNEYGHSGLTNKQISYEQFEVAHFRLNSDPTFYPYGKSYIENSRKTWKMLTLMEDASLMHRLMRSADRRKIFVDVQGLAPDAIPAHMENIMNKIKKTPLIDMSTGDYNLKFNMMTLLEDIYIPKRGVNDTSDIENLSGLSFAGMEDVEYYKQKLFNSLGIPKPFYTETNDLNGTSTLANLSINFVPQVERIQNSIECELYKIALVHLYARGYRDNNLINFDIELTSPSILYEQEKINLLKDRMDLATMMMDSNLFSSDHIYADVFHLSEDEYSKIRDEVIEDKIRIFRLSQIENEGNDPLESGTSYGTPHDLASLYNDETTVSKPDPYSDINNLDKNPIGRPSSRSSNINKDTNPMGRDRLGTNAGFDVSPQTNTNPNTNVRLMENLKPTKVNVYKTDLKNTGLFKILNSYK